MLWKHYKHALGAHKALYKILHIATHETSLEQMVVYQAVGCDRVWVRPYDEFFGRARLTVGMEDYEEFRFKIHSV